MQPEKSLNDLTEQERKYYQHPTLGNLYLWSEEDLTFVIDRLATLLGDGDLYEGPTSAGFLIAAAHEARKENPLNLPGVLNGIWMALHYISNIQESKGVDEKALSGACDFLCRYNNPECGTGWAFANPFSGKAMHMEPNGGAYEIDVLKRLMSECSGDHPAHRHLYEALGHLQRQPLLSHMSYEERLAEKVQTTAGGIA